MFPTVAFYLYFSIFAADFRHYLFCLLLVRPVVRLCVPLDGFTSTGLSPPVAFDPRYRVAIRLFDSGGIAGSRGCSLHCSPQSICYLFTVRTRVYNETFAGSSTLVARQGPRTGTCTT